MENTKFGNYRFISVTLLVIAFFIFLEAHYYHRSIKVEMPRAEVITKITSSFWSIFTTHQAGMSASNGLVTEDTAVAIIELFAFVLTLVSVLLVWINRKKNGPNELDIPIIFASGLLGVWIIFTVINTGGIYTIH